MRWLAHGRRMDVMSYHGYHTNSYYFYAKAHKNNCTIKNSGVTLVAQSKHVSSAKDNKLVFANTGLLPLALKYALIEQLRSPHCFVQCNCYQVLLSKIITICRIPMIRQDIRPRPMH